MKKKSKSNYNSFVYQKKYINSEEIGTIMDFNPYETKKDLIKKKLFGIHKFPDPNEKIKDNKKIKPYANLFFSILKKRNYKPAFFVKDFFSSCLDGYHINSKTILEIKCPLNKNDLIWKIFFQKQKIPLFYWSQIQCNLYCSEAEKAYFFVYLDEQEFYLKEIFLNKEFIQEMIIKCQNFQKLLKKYEKLFEKKITKIN
jgi:putative phage-type endonuclease